ncbi:MAG: hypothetical protein L0Y71_08750, partial [Gemmataceae bacterium]|nr:hypothetical protein [Gemmataceae bacterium]
MRRTSSRFNCVKRRGSNSSTNSTMIGTFAIRFPSRPFEKLGHQRRRRVLGRRHQLEQGQPGRGRAGCGQFVKVDSPDARRRQQV